MTQEEKNLLLKDLCCRLPYGVKCHIEGEDGVALPIGGHIKVDNIYAFNFIIGEHKRLDFKTLEEFKPYLFPLSSMTEEQKEEERSIKEESYYSFDANGNIYTLQDFYNKNHIDYRGLIPKELAIDATNLNIY